MAVMTMVQAINQALHLEMERDPRVIVIGEDVGKDGGVFRVTEGLFEKFGSQRVVSTPLSESAIVGTSIGLAAFGMRPVAEIQFDGFMPPTFDQLISHAARIRNRSRGRFSVPMVVRVPCGGNVRALEHHSDSPEAYVTNTPGLKVLVPSTPYEAKGLLLSAIRDPDPVIYFEPKRLYRLLKEDVPEEDYTIPIGQARVVIEGSDVSVITWGAMVKVAMEAAEKLKGEISVEVVDLRTLSPYDREAVVATTKKTGRVVVVHEAPKTCGFGAEISACINERVLLSLEAPVERVTGWDTVVPLPKLEQFFFPNAERVAAAIRKVASF